MDWTDELVQQECDRQVTKAIKTYRKHNLHKEVYEYIKNASYIDDEKMLLLFNVFLHSLAKLKRMEDEDDNTGNED